MIRMDKRLSELAKILVYYSTRVKKGDNVIILVTDEGVDLATAIYQETSILGASPLIVTMPTEALRGYYKQTPEEYLQIFPDHYYELIKASDVIISIKSDENTRYLSSVDPKKISKRRLTVKRIADERLKKRWCLTQYPTPAYAQEAGMSLKEYEDFVYSAMLLDWNKEAERMMELKRIMDSTDKVRIIGKETDITMSIKGRIAVLSDGTHNMPGGEVFTSPVDNSSSGKIFFDLPVVIYGNEVQDIRLEIENGIIVDYSANKNEDLLKAMIDTDEGSRRLGELGIGTNRGITKFTRNILFDEKIAGTIHLAIGFAYPECGGVNKSAVHWDMIKTIQTGQIMMDGETILKDGKFYWEE